MARLLSGRESGRRVGEPRRIDLQRVLGFDDEVEPEVARVGARPAGVPRRSSWRGAALVLVCAVAVVAVLVGWLVARQRAFEAPASPPVGTEVAPATSAPPRAPA